MPPSQQKISNNTIKSKDYSCLFGQFMLSETSTQNLLGTRILHERSIRWPALDASKWPALDALKRSCFFCLFGLLAPLACASSFHFSFVIVIVVVILAHIPNRELAQAT